MSCQFEKDGGRERSVLRWNYREFNEVWAIHINPFRGHVRMKKVHRVGNVMEVLSQMNTVLLVGPETRHGHGVDVRQRRRSQDHRRACDQKKKQKKKTA